MDKPARIRREFRFGLQRFADPDPSLTPEQVRDLLSQFHPELTTAAVQKLEAEGGKEIYSLEQSKGTRGVPAQARKETYEFVKSQGSRG